MPKEALGDTPEERDVRRDELEEQGQRMFSNVMKCFLGRRETTTDSAGDGKAASKSERTKEADRGSAEDKAARPVEDSDRSKEAAGGGGGGGGGGRRKGRGRKRR